jgi:hypothetical protein
MTQNQVILAFFLGEAIFWLGAYVLIIRQAFRDKIHGMPVAAMCGNIAWEFIFGLGLFRACPSFWPECPEYILGPATLGAALLDVVILYTILNFGQQPFEHPLFRRYFRPLVLASVALAFSLHYTFMSSVYTPDVFSTPTTEGPTMFIPDSALGGIFTGWGLAFMMSILFIAMLISRDNLQGQSFSIGLFMTLGNFCAYLFDLNSTFRLPSVIHLFAIASLTLNLAYVIMVYWKARGLGGNPWRF